MTPDPWQSFDAETARQVTQLRDELSLWHLEVLSTRCSWELWPSAATRAAYVQALSEREKCEATLLALDGAPEYRPAQRAFASD